MIIWFSGTGNTKWVAERLAAALNEQMISAAEVLTNSDESAFKLSLKDDERLGFVFPTYSWGPAPIIIELIEKMQLEGTPGFCFMVTTCGDDIGLSVNILRKALSKRNINLDSAYSVQMPNNYINLPGFDVDSDIVRNEKLHAAPKRVDQVAQNIAERRVMVDVVKGRFAWFKSRIIRSGFLKGAMSDKPFVVDANACTHCGVCEKNCPMNNISLADGTPTWNGRCAMCLSCLHRCPTRAIQYGKATVKKGRYYFKK